MDERIGAYKDEAAVQAEVDRQRAHGIWPGYVVHIDGSADLYKDLSRPCFCNAPQGAR